MQIQINTGAMRGGGLLGGVIGLGGCVVSLVVTALILVCVGGITFAFMNSFRSAEYVQQGFAIAQEHPAVIEAVGSPVELGWFVSGSVNTSGGTGIANVKAPISGPNGSATLEINARSEGGVWQVTSLHLSHGAEWINLLEP